MLHVKNIGCNIIHVTADVQLELALAFIRLQEFYEHPSKKIRGKYFTLEEVILSTAKLNKESLSDDYNFTYFDHTAGYNVPDYNVKLFIETFSKNDFGQYEAELIEKIFSSLTDKKAPFYVIGTYDENCIMHEVAHALFYLSKGYKKAALKLVNELPYLKQLKKRLLHRNYANLESILNDEVQAYMTETKHSLFEGIGFKHEWRWTPSFRELLLRYVKSLGINLEVHSVQ